MRRTHSSRAERRAWDDMRRPGNTLSQASLEATRVGDHASAGARPPRGDRGKGRGGGLAHALLRYLSGSMTMVVWQNCKLPTSRVPTLESSQIIQAAHPRFRHV